MELDFFWLGLGLAIFGYFIGDGLKNFKNPSVKGFWESLDEEDEHRLIQANDVHNFIGVSKEDAKKLLDEHPEIPHVILNGQVYYPQVKLKQWLLKLGE